MPLHLLKLCVGCDSIADLEDWIAMSMTNRRRQGQPLEQVHTTRMVPKRVSELTDNGSLYWVIKGQVSCRQKILAIRPFTDTQGIGRCHIVLEPIVTTVMPRPHRAFQGWRYLQDHEKPQDLGDGLASMQAMPEELRRDLANLGLL
ncbi:MAG: DUF1489 family protein [Methylocystaceae bacterium]|jgi:hypothetical protein|nr:DUF1489 family protein [Methylocystaceae bacterium]